MTDVLIVGLGPTGATLAHLLAMRGVDVVVVERHAAIHPLPRAVHFDDEVMRVFQTIGVADQIAAVSRINPGMRFVDRNGATLLDWPRPNHVSPQGWHPSYRFHQPDLEAILRAALADRGVRVVTGDVIDVAQSADGITARIQGQPPINAAYVVGCDGGRSTVRAAMGTTQEDLGFHERWLVIDVELTRDRPDLGDITLQHCDPDQPATYVRGPGTRRRWEIALMGRDVDPTDPDQV